MLSNLLNPKIEISASIVEMVNRTAMPYRGFQRLTDIVLSPNHEISFTGADEEGLRLTCKFSYRCDDGDCEIDINEDLPLIDYQIVKLITDELDKEQSSERDERRDRAFDEVLSHLPEVLDRIEESVGGADWLGKVYLCDRTDKGNWIHWRLFIPFTADTTVYPYMLEGITLDTDGEAHPAEFSIIELSEPVRDLSESEFRRIQRLHIQ